MELYTATIACSSPNCKRKEHDFFILSDGIPTGKAHFTCPDSKDELQVDVGYVFWTNRKDLVEMRSIE